MAKDGKENDVLKRLAEALKSVDLGDAEQTEDVEVYDEAAVRRVAEQAPIVRVANTLIEQAIRGGASTILITPWQRHVAADYEINGVMSEEMTIPKYIQAPLIGRFKAMSDANLAERRVPQTGYAPCSLAGKKYRLVIDFVPSQFGEIVQVEICDLDPKANLADFGMDDLELEQYKDVLNAPSGLVLIFAPSRKASQRLLYATIRQIANTKRIVLAEEKQTMVELPQTIILSANNKISFTLENAVQAGLNLHYESLAMDGIQAKAIDQILLEGSSKLCVIATTAAEPEDLVLRLTDYYDVKPKFLASRIKAVLYTNGQETKAMFGLQQYI